MAVVSAATGPNRRRICARPSWPRSTRPGLAEFANPLAHSFGRGGGGGRGRRGRRSASGADAAAGRDGRRAGLRAPGRADRLPPACHRTATVMFSRDRNAGVLVMNNVPPPSPGTVYQMWLIGANGPDVGRDDGHRGRDAVDHGDAANLGSPALAFTVEPGAGSPQPTSADIGRVAAELGLHRASCSRPPSTATTTPKPPARRRRSTSGSAIGAGWPRRGRPSRRPIRRMSPVVRLSASLRAAADLDARPSRRADEQRRDAEAGQRLAAAPRASQRQQAAETARAAAPMLTQGPQVASRLSCPCRTDCSGHRHRQRDGQRRGHLTL